jgi:hypothetical protein
VTAGLAREGRGMAASSSFVTKVPPKSIDTMAMAEVVDRIETLNQGIAKFWSQSDGWAPVTAAGLLGKSRLDWQASLSGSLRLWMREPPNALTPAELILAWANLGSLVEGTIKTLLSVWYETYKADIDNLKKANAYDNAKQVAHAPDGLGLEKLRNYCKTKELLGAEGDALVELVQQRRNAIHAFKDRPIGDGIEFQKAVRSYLALLRSINGRLPYPDEMYEPREH